MMLALDIGGTFIKSGLWINESLEDTNAVVTPKTWKDFVEAIKSIKDNAENTRKQKITGIACSFPGIVNTKTGVIGGASSVPYIHGFSVTDALNDLFNIPVSIENDAKCALLAEHQYGNAQGFENVALMVIGTGVGGALLVNGQLLKGRNLYAGELGCLLMDNEIMLSDIGSTARMVEEFRRSYDVEEELDGMTIFDLYDKSDYAAKRSVNLFYDYLAKGVFNTLVTFDPEIVLLGGGVSARPNFAEDIAVRVQKQLDKQRLYDLEFTLKTCRFDNRANLIGAIINHKIQKNEESL